MAHGQIAAYQLPSEKAGVKLGSKFDAHELVRGAGGSRHDSCGRGCGGCWVNVMVNAHMAQDQPGLCKDYYR